MTYTDDQVNECIGYFCSWFQGGAYSGMGGTAAESQGGKLRDSILTTSTSFNLPKVPTTTPPPLPPRDHVFNHVILWGTFFLQNTMSSQSSVPGWQGGSAGKVTCCQGWWPKVDVQSPHCGRRPPQACHGMPMPTHKHKWIKYSLRIFRVLSRKTKEPSWIP